MAINNTTPEEKLKVKQLPEFKDLDILDTWFEDIMRLDDEIKEKQKYLRKVKSERKKQPSIQTVSVLGKQEQITNAGYQIIITTSGKVGFCKDW